MQVPHDEGVANHIGPESCAGAREGTGEALAGEHTGQPLSRESFQFRVPTPFTERKATRTGATSRAPGRPGVVETLACATLLVREPGDLAVDRSAIAAGPHREGEEP